MKKWFARMLSTACLTALCVGGLSTGVCAQQVYDPSALPAATAYYSDVAGEKNYGEGIAYVTRKGLMSGTGGGQFSPGTTLTRAQIVQILYSLAGSPDAEYDGRFTDVAAVAWYAQPVSWASGQGIVSGTGEGRFSPDTKITREQVATIIGQYVQAEGLELAAAQSCVRVFKDSWSISSYALDGVDLLWRTGIMNGDSQHNFGPRDQVSRAEAADIFMRLDRAVNGEHLTASPLEVVVNHDALSAAEKDRQARAVAKQLAEAIMAAVPEEESDLLRVSVAAYYVASYCTYDEYTMDGKDYRTGYGVFIKGEYSCAGSTRALGMVLDYMGYEWTHVNENMYSHQWCELIMDGKLGYADGQTGEAYYYME